MNDEGEVMSTGDRLVYMAEQIARNFAVQGHDQCVTATADHIASFWDPRMKDRICVIARDQPGRLSPAVAAAVARLAQAMEKRATR